MFAILDIETTGGKFNEEGITEIAIYKFDGHQIVDQFISLVNPEKNIQDFVVKLTGITNQMVKKAPKFHEIAKRIIEITEDCILVAHNTSFDYRILKIAYKRLGYDFKRNTLCTVSLSEKLIPNQESYSLGKLTNNLGIPLSNRHRASGDALATVELFKLLLEKDVNKEIIENHIKYIDKRNVKKKYQKILENLPEEQGVFYVHNSEGNIIFIGKGNNLRLEVNKLFLKESNRAKKINQRIQNVTYELTGNPLLTSLKYYMELGILKPKFNSIRKRKLTLNNFNHSDFLIINKGRTIEERSVVLIENNEVIGYTYTNLSMQENELDILRSLITPVENKQLAKTIVKNYLKTKKPYKIIRLNTENI